MIRSILVAAALSMIPAGVALAGDCDVPVSPPGKSQGKGKGHGNSNGKGHFEHGNGKGYGHIKHGECPDEYRAAQLIVDAPDGHKADKGNSSGKGNKK